MERTIRVLHVEDDSNWREIVKRKITRKSVELDQASSIIEAKQLINQRQYELIIADLDMSGNSDTKGLNMDDFDRLMFGLGIDKGNTPLDERPRIVVLTGFQTKEDAIRNVMNKYPGWIWGWLEKAKLDGNGFEKLESRIEDVIGELELHRVRTQKLVYGSIWPGGFLSLLSYVVGVLIIWLVYQTTSNTVLTLLISVIPLGLLITTQAYFLKINKQLSDASYQAVIVEVLKQMFSWRIS